VHFTCYLGFLNVPEKKHFVCNHNEASMQSHCLHTEPKKTTTHNHAKACSYTGIYNEQMLDCKIRQQHFFLNKKSSNKIME